MFPKKTNVMAFAGVACALGSAPLQVSGAVTLTVPAEAVVYFAGQSQPVLQATFPPTSGWETDPWDVAGMGDVTNFFNDSAPWEGVVRAEVNAGEAEGFTIEGQDSCVDDSSVCQCRGSHDRFTYCIRKLGAWTVDAPRRPGWNRIGYDT